MGAHRETCTVVCALLALTNRVDTQTGRTVSKNDRRNTKTINRVGCTCCTRNNLAGVTNLTGSLAIVRIAGTDNEVNLLVDGQLLDDLVDVVLCKFELFLCCGRCSDQQKCCHTTQKNFFHTFLKNGCFCKYTKNV